MRENVSNRLAAFHISDFYDNRLSRDELGKLVVDFGKKFGNSWSLLIQPHIALDKQGYYTLYVVAGLSEMSNVVEHKLTEEEEKRMISFIDGYCVAVRSYKEKPHYW